MVFEPPASDLEVCTDGSFVGMIAHSLIACVVGNAPECSRITLAIHSRGDHWSFSIDAEGHISDLRLAETLQGLKRVCKDVIYLGSFSKLLAPGLRLGYVVAPPALYTKLLQAKQAADLHTPGFNQRLVWEVVKDGFLATTFSREDLAGIGEKTRCPYCIEEVDESSVFLVIEKKETK